MTRCSITCQEPGCNNKIFYTVANKREDVQVGRGYLEIIPDAKVSLYCWKHRTREGRHAQVRVVDAKKYYGKHHNLDIKENFNVHNNK